MKPADNESNMQNNNKGANGTNKQWDDAQTNRNRQLQKNLYLTEYEAGVVANERRFATGITMHVYRCPEGGGWHITSNQRQW